MTYKHDGYYRDGSTMCVLGVDGNGCTVAMFKGYYNHKTDKVKLYPFRLLVPTREKIEKVTVHIRDIKR